MRANIKVLDRNSGPRPVLFSLDVASADMPVQLTVDRVADVGQVVIQPEARGVPIPDVEVVKGQLMVADGEGGWAEPLSTRLEPGRYSVVAQNAGREESNRVLLERLNAEGEDWPDGEIEPIEKWWMTFVG